MSLYILSQPHAPQLCPNVLSICIFDKAVVIFFLWVFISCLLPQVVFCNFHQISSIKLHFTNHGNLMIIVLLF